MRNSNKKAILEELRNSISTCRNLIEKSEVQINKNRSYDTSLKHVTSNDYEDAKLRTKLLIDKSNKLLKNANLIIKYL